MRRKLLLNDGARERELQLVGRIVVGRDPACEISHDDSLLSRRHAEFVASTDVVKVRDLGSRNGVFVNGTRAVERVLAEGDVIQIGPLRARYVIDRAAAGIAPEEFDGDRTAVIRKVFTGQSSPALADSPSSDTDEDATRLVPAPVITDDDGPTLFASAPPVVAGHLAGSTMVLDTPVRAVAALGRGPGRLDVVAGHDILADVVCALRSDRLDCVSRGFVVDQPAHRADDRHDRARWTVGGPACRSCASLVGTGPSRPSISGKARCRSGADETTTSSSRTP